METPNANYVGNVESNLRMVLRKDTTNSDFLDLLDTVLNGYASLRSRQVKDVREMVISFLEGKTNEVEWEGEPERIMSICRGYEELK